MDANERKSSKPQSGVMSLWMHWAETRSAKNVADFGESRTIRFESDE